MKHIVVGQTQCSQVGRNIETASGFGNYVMRFELFFDPRIFGNAQPSRRNTKALSLRHRLVDPLCEIKSTSPTLRRSKLRLPAVGPERMRRAANPQANKSAWATSSLLRR